MLKALHAFFAGSVQGVGFRYTTERIARHFEVTGYVRNLPDGRVELFAEGEEQTLKDFLTALREGPMKENIRDLEVEWGEAKVQYKSFGVAMS